jgi:hypothetical protein
VQSTVNICSKRIMGDNKGAAQRNINKSLLNRLKRFGASEIDGTDIDWSHVVGNGGEFVHYTTGVISI